MVHSTTEYTVYAEDGGEFEIKCLHQREELRKLNKAIGRLKRGQLAVASRFRKKMARNVLDTLDKEGGLVILRVWALHILEDKRGNNEASRSDK